MTLAEWIEERKRQAKIDMLEGDYYNFKGGFDEMAMNCYRSSFRQREMIREALEVEA